LINACTIIAGNYLAAARVLAESFFAHHSDGSFTVLIVDDEERDLVPVGEFDHRIAWWRLADLGLDTPEIHRLAGIYDVTELSTGVKPLFLRRLIETHESAVIYLDPDIRVFGSLAYVAQLADRHELVLTPHITQSIPDDGRQVDALFVLAAGVYNLGFAAVAPTAAASLEWWWQQTRRRALNDVARQMFTDQRWADYLPSLFSHHLLKDPGYNAAYWNLHERPLSRVNGRIYARNGPLRFFHFSGFDPRTPWLLSRHQGERPRMLLSEHPVLASLCDDYVHALERAGFATSSDRAYGWNLSADGLEMTRRIRRLYWSVVLAAERGEASEPPDPFDAADPEAFTEWLNAPDARGARRWSRYIRALYDARPDVQAHMPHIDGADAARFGNWLRTDGVVQEHIPPALTPPAPTLETPHVNGAQPDEPLKEGVNLTGYFEAELGVGEAARLLARAVEASGTAYVTGTLNAPISRQRSRFEPRTARTTQSAKGGDERRDAVAGAPFDVHVLCVNADMTPIFARDAGPSFFAGRHTVGYWFWEVDPLPASMHGAFDHVDEVWTATDYVADILRAASAGRKPVYTVPLPLVAPTVPSTFTRAQLGLPEDRFVFLFVFDFLSVPERKNPLGLIEAFSAAFAPGEGPVLVLKSINGAANVPALERLRRAAAHRSSDILIRDGYVSADEKDALLAACDCYVSLHRAEGLGLTLAEAMALGKPTIATGYSGNRHFMTDENSFLVQYEVIAASGDCGPYPLGARWADPDLSHAAQLMRLVYQRPTEAARRAERGRTDLLLHHGVMASASAVSQRLSEIRRPQSAAVSAPATTLPPLPAFESSSPVTVGASTAALESFAAAVPQLRQLGEPRQTRDGRPFQRLRHLARIALFRVMRPYWYQQRQFQDALIEAMHGSLERLAGPGAARVTLEPRASTEVRADVRQTTIDRTDERPWFGTARDLRASLIIFICCLFVYNLNGRVISAGDAFPARYQPFAIWKHHTVRLDPIASVTSQGREIPKDWQNPHPSSAFWMVPTPDGHLVSLYSVVLPVLVSPIYVPAIAYLQYQGWDDGRLDRVARIMEKVAASFIAALSVALLYLALRRRASPSIAILLVIAYAFGTTTWVISSQALWQHGMGQLLLVGLILMLTAPCSAPTAIAAGLFCGLIAGNRPADAILAAPLGLYALFWAGRRAGFVVAAAAAPLLLVLLYNVTIVGAISGGYQLVGKAQFFSHDIIDGFTGLLFSPTRGLFVFSPFLLFIVLAVRHRPRDRDEQMLTLAMATAVILQVLVYSKVDWRGGVSWGPRFLTDLLPLLIWMLVPIVIALGRRGRAVFTASVAVAIAIESVGAFAYTGVTDVPIYAITNGPDTLRAAWEWRNAPFIASLSQGLAPAEITLPMRGALDTFEVDGRVTDSIAVGQDVVAKGWALAGRRTPLQVGISIDGLGMSAARVFSDRPDVRRLVPGAGAAGWQMPLKTADLAPGVHRLALFVWASDKGDAYFIGRRTLTVEATGAVDDGSPALSVDWTLDAGMRTAAERIRAHQQPEGYWLTDFTGRPRFEQPSQEMNTYLTSLLVDLLDARDDGRGAGQRGALRDSRAGTTLADNAARARRHLTDQIEANGALANVADSVAPAPRHPTNPIDANGALANLAASVARARRHLTDQIEANGLVRYHGLPTAPGIGTLGCAITPDTDDTALVWRIAPKPDRTQLSAALATIERYRAGNGLYRTWLAPRERYQCLDPGTDPNPTDIAIQMHLLQLLLSERPTAGHALCDALRRQIADDRVWVYYQRTPLVPMLRIADLDEIGCHLTLPPARMPTTIPGQETWVSTVRLLTRASGPGAPRPDVAEMSAVWRTLARDDFAMVRQAPPLLYHNDLTATVPRYYWSEDVGYALWLRLAREVVRLQPVAASR
jgi:hypothetical protein